MLRSPSQMNQELRAPKNGFSLDLLSEASRTVSGVLLLPLSTCVMPRQKTAVSPEVIGTRTGSSPSAGAALPLWFERGRVVLSRCWSVSPGILIPKQWLL